MSEFCIEHMWYGEQACPHCHQPSDEPCCGVDAEVLCRKCNVEWTPAHECHPKAQERQHVSDAAWERIIAAEPDISRDEAEQEHAKRGCMTVTVEEWDARDRQYNELREQASAELATLRAQLQAADAENRTLRNVGCMMQEELERLRNGMKDASELAQTLVNESKPLDPAFSKVVDKQFWNLVLQSQTDHRLGPGNRLEGEPEYAEPKPVIRTRPML